VKILRCEEITPEYFAALRHEQLSPEELKEAHTLARAAFTAEDLQRYTELEPCIPAEDVLRELEQAEELEDRRSL
jgi:hypothetical protein